VLIDELVREGARRMLAEALQAEVDAYIAAFVGERDGNGRRLVVRNGTHQPREVLTSAGAVEVRVPRVNDKRIDPETGERRRFSSAILPPWCRKTPKITEVSPLLYLHGLSTGDFVPALGQFLGSTAGLSAPVITKLTETWKAEQRTFAVRDLSDVDFVLPGLRRPGVLLLGATSRSDPREGPAGTGRRLFPPRRFSGRHVVSGAVTATGPVSTVRSRITGRQ
jgi:transposase-like protein